MIGFIWLIRFQAITRIDCIPFLETVLLRLIKLAVGSVPRVFLDSPVLLTGRADIIILRCGNASFVTRGFYPFPQWMHDSLPTCKNHTCFLGVLPSQVLKCDPQPSGKCTAEIRGKQCSATLAVLHFNLVFMLFDVHKHTKRNQPAVPHKSI